MSKGFWRLNNLRCRIQNLFYYAISVVIVSLYIHFFFYILQYVLSKISLFFFLVTEVRNNPAITKYAFIAKNKGGGILRKVLVIILNPSDVAKPSKIGERTLVFCVLVQWPVPWIESYSCVYSVDSQHICKLNLLLQQWYNYFSHEYEKKLLMEEGENSVFLKQFKVSLGPIRFTMVFLIIFFFFRGCWKLFAVKNEGSWVAWRQSKLNKNLTILNNVSYLYLVMAF